MEISLDLDTAQRFALALLIGALVGIEREKKMREGTGTGIGGLRTFILFAQSGAIAAWLARDLDAIWILGAAILAVTGMVAAGYWAELKQNPHAIGLTTQMAAVTTTLLGALCVLGEPVLAVALGIITSAILAFKEPMHGVVERLGRDDIYAGLKLLIATFIVLPVLPRQPVDPWGALVPYTVWLLVILIAGLSLVGYVAVRWLGRAQGTAVSGLAGGMVSSTAATLNLARQSRSEAQSGAQAILLGAMLLAWAVMPVRVVIEVAVVNRSLVGLVAIPMAVIGVVTLVLAAVFWRRGTERGGVGGSPTDYRNPFSLWSAISFGAVFAVVLLAVALTRQYLPGAGLYAVSAVAGLTNVDAITLSLAQAREEDATTIVRAITVAVLANTAAKGAIFAIVGSSSARQRVLAVTATVLVAGSLAIFAV